MSTRFEEMNYWFAKILIYQYSTTHPSILNIDYLSEKIICLLNKFVNYHKNKWLDTYSALSIAKRAQEFSFVTSVYPLADELFHQCFAPVNYNQQWFGDMIHDNPDIDELLDTLEHELRNWIRYTIQILYVSSKTSQGDIDMSRWSSEVDKVYMDIEEEIQEYEDQLAIVFRSLVGSSPRASSLTHE